MIVRVMPGREVILDDPWDFKRFKLQVAAGTDAEALAAALGALGRVAGIDAVWMSAGGLHGLGPDDGAWRQALAEMIGKAATHGWVDQATGAVRAHVEQV